MYVIFLERYTFIQKKKKIREDQSGSERIRADQSGSERIRADQSGSERIRAYQSVSERTFDPFFVSWTLEGVICIWSPFVATKKRKVSNGYKILNSVKNEFYFHNLHLTKVPYTKFHFI